MSGGLHANEQSTQNMKALHFSAKTIITIYTIAEPGKPKLPLLHLHFLHAEDHSLYSLNCTTSDKHIFPSYLLGLL